MSINLKINLSSSQYDQVLNCVLDPGDSSLGLRSLLSDLISYRTVDFELQFDKTDRLPLADGNCLHVGFDYPRDLNKD